MAENGRKFWKYPRCFVLVGFARGQHLGENEFRLNVANYEWEFLPEYLRGINMSDKDGLVRSGQLVDVDQRN